MSTREPGDIPSAPRGPSDGYRRDRDREGDSGRRYEDRDAGRNYGSGSGSRRYEDDYRRGGGRGGGYDRGRSDRDRDRGHGDRHDRRPYDDDRRREGHRVGDRDGGGGYRDRDGDRDRRNGRPYDRPFPEQPPSRTRSRSPIRPLDKKSIEEGRRQRELERAQRAQRGESVHSASGSATGPPGTPNFSSRQQDHRRDRERSPAPYRRPRDQRGEHVDKGPMREDRSKSEEGEGRDEEEEDDGDMAAEEDEMAAMLGFGGFGSTKNQKVKGNVEGAAQIQQQRTWRQYMNRRGGFNRPLDPVKEPKVWH
ncbi:hypothetical protein FFLO_05076 [Filobasidium floriforme]|uniref:U4/U6.U5 small nuclear ribonucleoprotein 27kDa protein domain-containing protein n=1 Tax=Filobasidium floriforme TaxID=5210 RepID=A0A8K0JIV8_9TREE|nr:hypothetical protein FFLO_05076 [Filobasidium floriforme]